MVDITVQQNRVEVSLSSNTVAVAIDPSSVEVVAVPQRPIGVQIDSNRIDVELVKQYIVVCDVDPETPVNTVTGPADGPVSAYRVIAAVPAGLTHAVRTDLSHYGRVFGISLNAASSGQQVTVQTHGVVTNGAWTFSTGRVWLSTDGNMTQTPPTTGFSQVVGTAISATELNVAAERPVIL